MFARSVAPPPSLAHLVRSFHAFDDVHDDTTAEHRLYPECVASLAFLNGSSWFGTVDEEAQSDASLVRVPGVFVERPRPQPVRLVSRGRTRIIGVDLYLWGASRLFGPWLHEDVLVGSLIEPPFAKKMERLLAEDELDEALHQLEAFVLQRAREVDIGPSAATRVAMKLNASHGHGRIDELAEGAGVCVRQLERQFQDQVGMSPKRLARVIRFERAENRIRESPGVNLTALAHDLGYADQAHFSREFRALARITPTEHAANMRTAERQRKMSHSFKEAQR